ncbi:MAG: hypothetical protein ABGW95_04645 [Candidatus Poseidoniia archaeon]
MFGTGRGVAGKLFGLRLTCGAASGYVRRMGLEQHGRSGLGLPNPERWNCDAEDQLLRMFPELSIHAVAEELRVCGAVLSGSGPLRAVLRGSGPLLNWYPNDLDIFVTTAAKRWRVVRALMRAVPRDMDATYNAQGSRVHNVVYDVRGPLGADREATNHDGREGMPVRRTYQVLQLPGRRPFRRYLNGERKRWPLLWKRLGVWSTYELYDLFGITGSFDLAVCQVSVKLRRSWCVNEDGYVSMLDIRISAGCTQAVEEQRMAFYLHDATQTRFDKYHERGFPTIGMEQVHHGAE